VSSTIVIEELTGSKRKLELTGTGLPFRPAGFGDELTMVTQFYPGNRRGTQQILTPKVSPSDWSGMWRTTSLLRAPCSLKDETGVTSIGFAHNLWEVFRRIFKGGQLLRVTWSTESLPPTVVKIRNAKTGETASANGVASNPVPQRNLKVVRLGRIKTFVANPETVDDIGWSATFDWIADGDTEASKLQDVSFDLVAKIQLAISSQDGVSAKNASALRAPPKRWTLGDLESFAKGPLATFDSFARAADNVTSRMHDLGQLLQTIRSIPASLEGRALDVANYAVSTANNFCADMSRTPIEVTVNQSRVSLLSRSLSYYSGAMTQAQLMASINTDIVRAASRRRSGTNSDGASGGDRVTASDLITVYMPRAGDTFGSIAVKYYGTDDVSGALARANGMSAYVIQPPRGVALIIPTRSVLNSIERRAG
jgi:LysM repeat protein